MVASVWFLSNLVFFASVYPLRAESSPSLLINEVMFRPIDNENTNEWIELYNPTSDLINVDGWMIGDEKETDTIQADEVHGDGTTIIPSGGYAIVTDKGTTLYESIIIPDDAIRLSVDDSTLCGYGLNNNMEKILLFDSTGICIDAVEWGQEYDDVPGSPASVVAKGNSLARKPDIDTDDSSVDFVECSSPTPGGQNLVDDDSFMNNPFENLEYNSGVVLITELYHHTHTNMKNEFICLFNPTNKTIDVSGWYLTDEPWKEPDDQPKIIFPDHTQMLPNSSWFITQNATVFFIETLLLADFEYQVDSQPNVSQMRLYRTFSLSNTGGAVGLCTSTSLLIDLIIYGDANYDLSCWEGPNIPASGQGVVLKRNRQNETFVDTNTALDWIHPRIYHIGQSDFPLRSYPTDGEIIAFVSPDSSYEIITNELRNACFSIDINMYEFTNPFLYKELIDALKRNITVRLFMEGSPIGGIDERETYILANLVSAGAMIRFIVSDAESHVHARYQFDHAKYVIIDNETMIVESCNWAKTGVPKNPSSGNREWGVVIHDEQVASNFLQVFEDDWNPQRRDSYPFERLNFTIPSGFSLNYEAASGSYSPRFSAKTITSPSRITPVFSPDNSEQAILDAIDSATSTIYIQQLYVYRDWGENPSPFVQHLINKSQQGVRIQIILDYNSKYESTTGILNETKQYVEDYGVEVKYISSDWSPFATVHNKGMIIDNKTVLISSINWNEQSVRKNREAGVLIENEEVAAYYATVFLSDWALESTKGGTTSFSWADYKYLMFIALVICITLVLIARDWRKRKWS